MKIKTIILSLAFTAGMLSPLVAKNNGAENTKTEKHTGMTRLREIASADRSQMNSETRKEYHNELLEMQKSAHSPGGIYISVGGLLLILILLIIFL